MTDYRALWEQDARRWDEPWGPLLDAQRAALGLAPVSNVRSHVLTDRPWLAADPTLAPWPDPADPAVVQTGAWILPDERPLSPELQAFLDAGEPPIYFGFGSIRAPEGSSRAMIESARALGRRAIVLRGWADLSVIDDQPDCLAIGEVNQQALFQRVAAVVHHGGAGTTTAAARAGAPQVIIPQHYDQPYFAGASTTCASEPPMRLARRPRTRSPVRSHAPSNATWPPAPKASPPPCAATGHRSPRGGCVRSTPDRSPRRSGMRVDRAAVAPSPDPR